MADPNWDDTGLWIGPRDFRTFVSANRFLVSVWAVVLMSLAWACWVDVADIASPWFSVPLGVATGGLAWLALTFGFSRGWIADDD